MSLFYKSNESKERKYVKENKIREVNEEAQQQIVDDYIAKELGLETKATNIGLLSARVASKLATANIPSKLSKVSEPDILLSSINNGKLTELFDKIKLLPASSLNKTQQIIRDDLKNDSIKKTINELIAYELPNGPDAIRKIILESLGGVDNIENVLDMIKKADKIKIKDFTLMNNLATRMATKRENELMGLEDINYALPPIPSKAATPAEIKAQAEAQADLDLIALFQQDVKEARKKQSLKDLDELNAQEDLRLRKKFMNVLEEMKTEITSMNQKEQSKKKYQEDKMILDKMMNLIENQRMHDSFLEYSKLATQNEFRKKIARNLESAFNYRKIMNTVSNLKQEKERALMASEDINAIPKRGRPKTYTKGNAATYAKQERERAIMMIEDLNSKKNEGVILTNKQRKKLIQDARNSLANAEDLENNFSRKTKKPIY